MPVAIAVCPICTPALVALLGIAAAVGSPLFGATLLLAFAIGRAVPVALGAAAMGWLESLSVLQRYEKVFDIVGALTLILSGFHMLNALLHNSRAGDVAERRPRRFAGGSSC